MTIDHALSETPSENALAAGKGRVLFVGASFYNNWYLSRELRRLGWVADTLVCSAEQADDYIHGTDYYVEINDTVHAGNARLQRLLSNLAEDYRQYVCGRDGPPENVKFQGSIRLAGLSWKSRVHAMLSRVCFDKRSRFSRRVEKLIRKTFRAKSPDQIIPSLRCLFHFLPMEDKPKLEPLCHLLENYDIIHFTGVHSVRLFYLLNPQLFDSETIGWDVELVKRAGKKIVYTNIGCLDGVTQSRFRQWGPEPVCDICRWRDEPSVCSDERNRQWGALRNHLADFIVNLGGNRADFNMSPIVHEVPEFYCLDPDVWNPEMPIPDAHRLQHSRGIVRIYHAVGNYDARTHPRSNVNIKSTHVIVPTIDKLKTDGYPVELIFCKDMKNLDVRYYQIQSDIVVDMLTFGFFGANIREALMLGKVAVCYLRPEWLESMRAEIPDYVDELPVVSATPQTIYNVLVDLVENPNKRVELGRRGRQFALKWHSRQAAGRRFDQIYRDLLAARADQGSN